MFKSNLVKNLFCFLFIFTSACGFWRADETTVPRPTPFVAEEIRNQIPFSTKEPDVYQTEIIIITDGVEEKIFVARNGNSRRYDYGFGKNYQVSFIENAENRKILINHNENVYTEDENLEQSSAETSENRNDFLTNGWLNQKADAKFENLGTENNLTKFLARFDGEEHSEVLIYVDENLKLPIKQEFFSVKGEQKTLSYSVEMKNFKSEADAIFFALPKDYRKVLPKEFQEILRQGKLTANEK